jgi:hypothetical protein
MFISRAPNPDVDCNSMEYFASEGVVPYNFEQFEERQIELIAAHTPVILQ